ncbi:MAG: DUF6464 family protein [Geitlerinemataceae cyanobacterium]
MFLLEILFIFGLSIVPAFMSLWYLQTAQNRARQRLTLAGNTVPPFLVLRTRRPYGIGNLSCRYNAKSSYIRCAINPCGPCENCRHYEPLE